MSNALARLEPKNLTETKGVAQLFAASGMFQDAHEMSQAFVKIMAGREVGIGAFASMLGVHMIDGKPAYGANLMAAAVKRSEKYDYRVQELTPEVCTLVILEHGEVIGTETLTMETVIKNKLDQGKTGRKTNWAKFPKNMLFARTLSNAVRFYCPDVFDLPVYTPDEFDVDEPASEVMIINEAVEQIIEDKIGSYLPVEDDDPPAPAGDAKLNEYFPRDAQRETGVGADDECPFATSNDVFTSAVCDTMKAWMSTHGMADHPRHAANIILQAITAPPSTLTEWADVYRAHLITSDVWAAVVANRAEKAQEG